MNISRLSIKNVLAKPFSTGLSLLLLSLGVGMISLMLHLDKRVKSQMTANIKGVDMVVGAKGSPLQLVLSAVFQLDVPTGNINLEEANKLLKNRLIDYGIPLAYGDTYKGFRIVGTNVKYPQNYNITIDQGRLWENPLEVSIGASVAKSTGLNIGDTFYGSHGLVEGGSAHENHAYHVVGIFTSSGTVVDQLVLTSVESVWEIHNDHDHDNGERQRPHLSDNHGDQHQSAIDHDHDHEKAEAQADLNTSAHDSDTHQIKDDREITALLVKFKNPLGLVQLPRMVNENTNMQAALPNFELTKLFSLMGMAASVMSVVAFIVILVSGLSVFISLYLGLKDRVYEMALMRTYGATKLQLLGLIIQEGLFVAMSGFIIGLLLCRIGLWMVSVFLNAELEYGQMEWFILEELYLFIATLMIGFISSLIPAISVYKIDVSKILSNE